MRHRLLASLALGCMALVPPAFAAFEYEGRIDLPVTGYNGPYDSFGTAIEAANGSVLVSAPTDDWPGTVERGSIFSFVRRDGTWEVADVIRPEPGACELGAGMAADGNDAFALVVRCGNSPTATLPNGQLTWVQRLRTSGDGQWSSDGLMPGAGDLPAGLEFFRIDASSGTFAGTVGERFGNDRRVYVFDIAAGRHEIMDLAGFGIVGPRVVTVSGDRMAVSYGTGIQDSKIALLEREEGTWRVVATLTDPDDGVATTQTLYGVTTLLRGDDLFVGAPGTGRPTPRPGAVHHYRRGPDGTWTLIHRISPAGGRDGERFGTPLLWNSAERELIVGASSRNRTLDAYHSAAMYRYCLDAQWTQCGYADALTPNPLEDGYAPVGASAAVADGDLLFADRNTFNADGTGGLVSVRRRDAALGIAGAFHSGYGGHYAGFGERIAHRDGYAAVPSRGRVDVYARTDAGWQHDAVLLIDPPSAHPDAACGPGYAAMGPGYLVVERICSPAGTIPADWTVYQGLAVFRRSGGVWSQQATDLPPSESAAASYGPLVVSGDRVYYATRPLVDAPEPRVGKLLAFDPATSTWGAPVAAPAPINDDAFGLALQADDRRMLVGTRSQVHVYATSPGSAPQLQATLALPPGTHAFAFASDAAFGERSIFVAEPSTPCTDQAYASGRIHQLRQVGNGWEYGDTLCMPLQVLPRAYNSRRFALGYANRRLLVGYAATGPNESVVAELRRVGDQWQQTAAAFLPTGPSNGFASNGPSALVVTDRSLLAGVVNESHVDTGAPSGAAFAYRRSDVFTGDFEVVD